MPVPIPNITSHVVPQQRAQLLQVLPPGASLALRGVQNSTLLRQSVPDEHAQALLGAGMVMQTLGGFSLTDLGAARGAMESGT